MKWLCIWHGIIRSVTKIESISRYNTSSPEAILYNWVISLRWTFWGQWEHVPHLGPTVIQKRAVWQCTDCSSQAAVKQRGTYIKFTPKTKQPLLSTPSCMEIRLPSIISRKSLGKKSRTAQPQSAHGKKYSAELKLACSGRDKGKCAWKVYKSGRLLLLGDSWTQQWKITSRLFVTLVESSILPSRSQLPLPLFAQWTGIVCPRKVVQ